MRAILTFLFTASLCLAQGSFSCPDDSGTVIPFYTNTGSVDHQVNLTLGSGDATSDDNFQVIINDADGKQVGDPILVTPGGIPVITVPPGHNVTLMDPTDGNSDGVNGSYTVT